MLVPIALIVVLAWQRPYKQRMDLARAISNEVITFAILAIYTYYGGFVEWTSAAIPAHNALAILVIALLFLSLLINVAYSMFLLIHKIIVSRSLGAEKQILKNFEMEMQSKFGLLSKRDKALRSESSKGSMQKYMNKQIYKADTKPEPEEMREKAQPDAATFRSIMTPPNTKVKPPVQVPVKMKKAPPQTLEEIKNRILQSIPETG